MKFPKEDLTGRVFGRLTVVGFAGYPSPDRWAPKWHCVCSCDNKLIAYGYNLKNGNSESCGCLRVDNTKKSNTKHGMSRTPAYEQYCAMLSRCYNPNNKKYKLYGGRGIGVCISWMGDGGFERFLRDMGERPSSKHSIDRRDNDGIYGPHNCRWATKKEQSNNRRGNLVVEWKDKHMTLTQLCELRRVPYSRTYWRLKQGQSLLEALSPADGRSTRWLVGRH